MGAALMDKQDLRIKADALRWYHRIDLGHGVTTQGVDNSPERLARVRLPTDLSGRSVLDIGAWDGFFSFEAERRGASRVVAAIITPGTERAGGPGKARPGSNLPATCSAHESRILTLT